MNYLIKRGYGPNNGTVFNLLNAHGTEYGVVMASKQSDYSEQFSQEFKYVIHNPTADKLKVAVFALDFADESDKQPVLETLNRLLTERKFGEFTLPDDVVIMVSAWEHEYPDLFSEESVKTLFDSNVIDFTSSDHNVMHQVFDDLLKGIKDSKTLEKSYTHEADDSLSR